MDRIKVSFTPAFRAKVTIFCNGQDLTYDEAQVRIAELINEAEELSLQSLCSLHEIAQVKVLLELNLNKYIRES